MQDSVQLGAAWSRNIVEQEEIKLRNEKNE